MVSYLEIGQIVNTFGINGMVKVKPFTDDIKEFEYLKKIYIENKNSKKEYQIEEVKYHKDMVMLKLKGVDKIEEAEKLRNHFITIPREDAIPLNEGEYYIVDLLDSEVYTEDGSKLGILEDIFNTGSNDIYVVRDELGKQILLPAIEEVIKEIDIHNKKIIVHLIEGLQ